MLLLRTIAFIPLSFRYRGPDPLFKARVASASTDPDLHPVQLLLGTTRNIQSLGGQLGLIPASHNLISELTVACLRLPIHRNHILLKRRIVLESRDLLHIQGPAATSVIQPVDNEQRLYLFAQVIGICIIFNGPVKCSYDAS